MNLKNKVGFIVAGTFYSNSGKGHESNAREIINKMGWTEEWKNGDAQDFLVCYKGAIQLGSGHYSKKIIACVKFFNESKIDKIAKMYSIEDYEYDLVRY